MADKKTILIAGGVGFIGSNLALRLLSEGNEVIVVDNLITGSLANLKILEKQKDFKFIRHDIIKPLGGAAVKFQIDQIYNCACPASPVDFAKYPKKN